MIGARTIPAAVVLAAIVLATMCGSCGVGYLPGEKAWLLPPSDPWPLRKPAGTEEAAAVGTPIAAPAPKPAGQPTPSEPNTPSAPTEPKTQGKSQDKANRLALAELLEVVSRTYPELSIAEQRRVIARARQLAALGGFDLEVGGFLTNQPFGFYRNYTGGLNFSQPTGLNGSSFYGGYRYGFGDFDPTFDGKRVTNDGGEFAAGAVIPLLRGGSIDRRRRDLWGAGIERGIAESDAAVTRLAVTQEASEAYWRWVAAGRGLQVAQALLALADARQAGIETRVQRGDLPELEQIDNQRLVVGRRAMVVAARRALEGSAIALSLFFRDARGQPIVPDASQLPSEFPDSARPDAARLEQDVRRALTQRPELARLDQLVDRTDLERRFLDNQALPQLNFLVEGSKDLDRSNPTPTKGDFELFLGMQMTWSVQNRRANGQLEVIQGRLRQLQHQLQLQRDRVTAEVRDDFSALRASFERVEQTRRAAELAVRVSTSERRRFDLGVSTVLVLNLREEAAAEAQLRLVNSLRDYWIAVARYRASVGEDPARTGTATR